MEFGDDDEDWDAKELEALEVAAVNTYAATQQERSQHTRAAVAWPQVAHGNILIHPSKNDNPELQALLQEKDKFEKLARDKQGELLVVKSNIARANNEHAILVDRLQETNRQTKDTLTRELNMYKERIARLQTDMTFQMQELKDAKLKTAQLMRPQGSPSQLTKSRSNGFPDKIAFDRVESHEPRPYPSSARKRKRSTRQSAQDTALDDFDLAVQRSTSAPDAGPDLDITMVDIVPEPITALLSQNTNVVPVISRDDTKSSEISVRPDPGDRACQESFKLKPDKLIVYNYILEARAKDQDSSCVFALAQVRDLAGSRDITSQNLAQVILSSITNTPTSVTAEAMTLKLANLLLDRLALHKDQEESSIHLMCLLYTILILFPEEICRSLIPPEKENLLIISVLQDLSDAPHQMATRRAAVQLFAELVDSIDRDQSMCLAIQKQLRPSLCKSLLVTTQDLHLRLGILHILARLTTRNGTLLYPQEILDYISHSFEKDDEFHYDELVQLRSTAAQCLYCIVTNLVDGLAQVRKSKHVIPRILRLFISQLDKLHDFNTSELTLPFLRILLKLYHLLLKDDSNQTSDEHWRVVELRAAHLTGMTRIVYAEESDGFDSLMQDMAMDLLEMAVSPEEGNDIYEIMGGGY